MIKREYYYGANIGKEALEEVVIRKTSSVGRSEQFDGVFNAAVDCTEIRKRILREGK